MIEAKYIAGTPELARFDFSRLNSSGVDKTQARINKAAEHIWNMIGDKGTEEVPILFGDLTKKQKLDLLAVHLERVINDAAKAQIWNEQQNAARLSTETGIEEN